MSERFFGRDTIDGVDGEHSTPYMMRLWIGRLRLHIFHRGDVDPDCHDHPWDFWTFPLTSYVEEVVKASNTGACLHRQIVPAWHLTFRPATHTHRVLGRYAGEWPTGLAFGRPVRLSTTSLQTDSRRIITIVWLGRGGRAWGFLKHRDGRWCWTPWKEYVFGGGKHAPCEPAATPSERQEKPKPPAKQEASSDEK
jgi:hypothetical protein